ncbi:uncharacterized protein LOC117121708 [Anneissia japonica]|uniref:uncharacterized protein LOC117121708 n=1 Tax=Anneissia japonica TaxID=1529436 RepID=UPI001425B5B4|nr:uncharacterized protein LOC117121708 [Anneissia japonica]
MFRLRKVFFIFLLLTSATGRVESAIHDLCMSRANGRLLSSHSLHHSSVRGLTDCVQLCFRHSEECSSIAYDEDSQMCDLFFSIAGQLVALMFPTNVLLYTIPYRDCTDVKQRMSSQSGVYKIKPCSSCDAFLTYCDMDTDGKAWTVGFKYSSPLQYQRPYFQDPSLLETMFLSLYSIVPYITH